MVHLAPMGYVYSEGENRLGQKVATGGFHHPKLTICGLSLTPETVHNHATVLPHDHPGGCPQCLQGLSSQTLDKVQPIAL